MDNKQQTTNNLQRKLNSGFSIMELVIVVGIMAGVILVISQFGKDIFDFKLLFGESFQIQQELQSTLKTLTTELRSMAPSNTGSYPIEMAATGTLIFYADLDKDGLFERIHYFASGNIFRKGIIKPSGNPLTYASGSEIIADKVNNLVSSSSIFSYFDANYKGNESPMTYPVNIQNVRLIKATLTANRDMDIKSPNSVTFSVQATIRNLRSNL